AVIPPEQALPLLVVRERETISQRERLAEQLGQRLASLVTEPESGALSRPRCLADEPLQIIRNRQVFADTFDRLQLEAERQVDIFVKEPSLIRGRKIQCNKRRNAGA
ncbi:MAG: hypothetical protein ABIU29_00205, partial [Chthoniobacterales bacterium]